MQKKSLNFQSIKKNISNIFNEFKESKDFDEKIEIEKITFQRYSKNQKYIISLFLFS